jgi:hypothetical protein
MLSCSLFFDLYLKLKVIVIMIISKSKYMKGLQCSKLLWTVCNAIQNIPETDAGTQVLFDEGEAVGELAQSLFPGGILVERTGGCGEMIQKSQALLISRQPIFEASFSSGGVYAQADILNPVEDEQWDIVEVKMSTSVKPQHIQDVALQRHCYEGAGVAIRNCYLMHINNQYVRKGKLDTHTLLALEDITEKVTVETIGIASRIAEMHRVIKQQTCPDIKVGPHCYAPYTCPLLNQCQLSVEEQNTISPSGGELTYNADGIRNFLGQLVYPLYLLDFETFMRAIPPYDESWPYMKIPFQFSLHVVEKLDAEPIHHSWLWDGTGDPRPLMLSELKNLIGDKGSVMAYFKSFEEGRLNESADAFPEYAAWVEILMPRMVDLIVPFRSHAVCHTAQNGSNSLKAVLPAITGNGYKDLAIQDGNTASAEFVRVTYGDVTDEERTLVRHNLEAYCGLDTIGMLYILRKLASLIDSQ